MFSLVIFLYNIIVTMMFFIITIIIVTIVIANTITVDYELLIVITYSDLIVTIEITFHHY